MQVFIDVLAFAPGKLLPKTAMERGRERDRDSERGVYIHVFEKQTNRLRPFLLGPPRFFQRQEWFEKCGQIRIPPSIIATRRAASEAYWDFDRCLASHRFTGSKGWIMVIDT